MINTDIGTEKAIPVHGVMRLAGIPVIELGHLLVYGTLEMIEAIFEVEFKVGWFIFEYSYDAGLRESCDRLVELDVAFFEILLLNRGNVTCLNWGRHKRVSAL